MTRFCWRLCLGQRWCAGRMTRGGGAPCGAPAFGAFNQLDHACGAAVCTRWSGTGSAIMANIANSDARHQSSSSSQSWSDSSYTQSSSTGSRPITSSSASQCGQVSLLPTAGLGLIRIALSQSGHHALAIPRLLSRSLLQSVGARYDLSIVRARTKPREKSYQMRLKCASGVRVLLASSVSPAVSDLWAIVQKVELPRAPCDCFCRVFIRPLDTAR